MLQDLTFLNHFKNEITEWPEPYVWPEGGEGQWIVRRWWFRDQTLTGSFTLSIKTEGDAFWIRNTEKEEDFVPEGRVINRIAVVSAVQVFKRLDGQLSIGQLDGYILQPGDRVLLIGQSDPAEKGLYEVAFDDGIVLQSTFDLLDNDAVVEAKNGHTAKGQRWRKNGPNDWRKTEGLLFPRTGKKLYPVKEWEITVNSTDWFWVDILWNPVSEADSGRLILSDSTDSISVDFFGRATFVNEKRLIWQGNLGIPPLQPEIIKNEQPDGRATTEQQDDVRRAFIAAWPELKKWRGTERGIRKVIQYCGWDALEIKQRTTGWVLIIPRNLFSRSADFISLWYLKAWLERWWTVHPVILEGIALGIDVDFEIQRNLRVLNGISIRPFKKEIEPFKTRNKTETLSSHKPLKIPFWFSENEIIPEPTGDWITFCGNTYFFPAVGDTITWKQKERRPQSLEISTSFSWQPGWIKSTNPEQFTTKIWFNENPALFTLDDQFFKTQWFETIALDSEIDGNELVLTLPGGTDVSEINNDTDVNFSIIDENGLKINQIDYADWTAEKRFNLDSIYKSALASKRFWIAPWPVGITTALTFENQDGPQTLTGSLHTGTEWLTADISITIQWKSKTIQLSQTDVLLFSKQF